MSSVTLSLGEHIHNPRVLFTVNEKTFEGNARIVDKDNESKLAAAKVSNLMDAKYTDGMKA
jgi:hypothetical protein